jgi:recombination protein RecT
MAVKETPKAEIVKKEISQAERFTAMVVKEASSVGDLNLSPFQKKLCQNYFIKLDQQLKDAEIKRLAQDEKYRPALEYRWENVNMPALALGVVAMSSVELDPSQPNHIFMIPYANKHTKKYDISFTKGYRGLEIVAMKYGRDIPEMVIVELVYSNDKFKIVKKDANNPVEKYTFEVGDAFDRGEIVGGFYYHIYPDQNRNKVVVMTIADIEKRKPAKASAEFWGGEKTKYTNGKPDGKETVDGWHTEMCRKTVYRAAYNDITIDSSKIDANFQLMSKIDRESIDVAVKAEITQNANTETLDISHEEIMQPEKKVANKEDKEVQAVSEAGGEDGKQEEIKF